MRDNSTVVIDLGLLLTMSRSVVDKYKEEEKKELNLPLSEHKQAFLEQDDDSCHPTLINLSVNKAFLEPLLAAGYNIIILVDDFYTEKELEHLRNALSLDEKVMFHKPEELAQKESKLTAKLFLKEAQAPVNLGAYIEDKKTIPITMGRPVNFTSILKKEFDISSKTSCLSGPSQFMWRLFNYPKLRRSSDKARESNNQIHHKRGNGI